MVRGRYTNKIWLIKRKKKGNKKSKISNTKWLPELSPIKITIYVNKPNKNAHKRILMSLMPLKYLEHKEANYFYHVASTHRQ
jgi:hypothetical protein